MRFSRIRLFRTSSTVLTWTFASITAFLLLGGCGRSNEDGPEQIIKDYFTAVEKKDLDGMLDCCTPENRKLLEKMEELVSEDEAVELIQEGKLDGILSSNVKGDRAELQLSVNIDGTKETETFTLRKLDGKWLIDVERETEAESSDKDPEESAAEKAVRAYLTALKTKDLDGVAACLSQKRRELFEKRIQAVGEEKVKGELPVFEREKVMESTVFGEAAQVDVSAIMSGQKQRVSFHLDGASGRWLIDTWSLSPDFSSSADN